MYVGKDQNKTYRARRLVDLTREEDARVVKVQLAKPSFLDHSVIEATFQFLDVSEHLIVVASGKQDLARVQLV